jgi:hypothetical protein
MRKLYSIYVHSTYNEKKLFITGVNKATAEKITQAIRCWFHLFAVWDQIPIEERKDDRRFKTEQKNANFSVRVPHRSMPVIHKITKRDAIKVQKGLKNVFGVTSYIRYWRPGSGGEFMKKIPTN